MAFGLSLMFRKVIENTIINVSRASKCTYLISSNKAYQQLYNPTSFQTVDIRTHASRNIPRQATAVGVAEQEIVPEISQQDIQITQEVISKVNAQIQQKSHGRLFAVVHVAGKQFKVTDEDLIIIEGYWPPQVGDELKLDKVLLAGSSDFTLIGRPILDRDLVSVQATVIEKTLSHIKTHFRKKRRKQYMRINFHRSPYTMLRINSIEFKGQINTTKEEDLEEFSESF